MNPTQSPDTTRPRSTIGNILAKPRISQPAAHNGAVSNNVRLRPAFCINGPDNILPTKAPSGGIAPEYTFWIIRATNLTHAINDNSVIVLVKYIPTVLTSARTKTKKML